MGQARAQFENAASTFAGQLGHVNDEIELLKSTWTGGASEEFGSAMADWENNFAIVIEELRAVVEAMGGGQPSTREDDR